jgi:hypothetical protein
VTEYRQHPRKSLHPPLAFQLAGGARIDALCRDISIGGAFIETDEPAPYGAEVVIYLRLPGLKAEVALASIVRWTKKGAGMGVQFSVMGARETHGLVQLIQGV